MAGFNNAIEQATKLWGSRTGRQKAFLIGGAAATVLSLGLFVRLIAAPDYKPVFTGLEAADSQSLSAQLEAKGIPHRTSPDGKSISVPADKLDQARLEIASHDSPRSGRMGFELLDKMSWGQTEFDEKVNYQRGLEGELERTLQTLKNVESARVHVVMSTDSVFLDRQHSAKASVILKLRRGSLSKDAVQGVARLVAGAVDDLKPEDVSIVDADSNISLVAGGGAQAAGEGMEADLTQRLINTLEPVAGADKIRANVNIEYDQGTTEESQEKYDPAVSVPLTMQRTEEQLGGRGAQAAGGVPGTGSNVPSATKTTTAATAAQDSTQTSKSESATYGVNKTVLHTIQPAGRIRRLTAAILVDDADEKNQAGGKVTYARRKRSADELRKIQELAQAAIGFDTARGDTVSVQNMSFQSGLTSEVAAPSPIDRARKTVSDFSSVLRPAALLVLFLMVYLFMLRPIQKQALGTPKLVQATASQIAAQPTPEQLAASPAADINPAQRAVQLKQQTIELIKHQPVDTARAVQAWLREEPS